MRLMLPCKKESYRHSEGVKLCRKKDEVPLLSVEALHQLHIFIFILGLVHVVFCATTILLGGAKIRKWKHWETEICKEMEHKLKQVEASPVGIVRNHQGEFISERTKGFWMKLAVVSWIIAFLKQFHGSVNKSDYKALRSAFGLRHFPHHPSFDFYKYMVRALEHDFKRVVGISWYLWLFVILFLLLNINGWHIYFWLAFLPLFVTYGFDSCIMEKKVYAISRLVIGVLIQVICSYVTLPLYAIVTHMDGGIKLQGLGSGLHEYVAEWALGARKKEEQSLVSGGAGATEVEAAGVRNSYEHFRGSPSPRIALAPPHGGLDEIVVEDGGGDNHHRR
uniref:Mlo family protein n=1 Tax=Oryza ridleyi TaxID=83308 RepID=C0JAC2_9ORYZ|nr:Mlo family protein [Oryza ridleyi]